MFRDPDWDLGPRNLVARQITKERTALALKRAGGPWPLWWRHPPPGILPVSPLPQAFAARLVVGRRVIPAFARVETSQGQTQCPGHDVLSLGGSALSVREVPQNEQGDAFPLAAVGWNHGLTRAAEQQAGLGVARTWITVMKKKRLRSWVVSSSGWEQRGGAGVVQVTALQVGTVDSFLSRMLLAFVFSSLRSQDGSCILQSFALSQCHSDLFVMASCADLHVFSSSQDPVSSESWGRWHFDGHS